MSDRQHPVPLHRPPYDFVQINHNPKAFLMRQSTPLSSRSPSVASWCSFDSDYEDGLVIEEIDSDDETDDSSVEVIEGEYEDPPSDDEYWDRWRNRRQLDYNHNVIIGGVGKLSARVPTPTFLSSQPLFYIPPTSPTPSTGSKRSHKEADTDEDETDREDNHSPSGRRTRRRLTHKAPSPLSRPAVAPATRNYGPHISSESEMEE